ncbi:DUF4259 domain-containing protein [Streptomyces canus]|uniref:DUF4259 domain-containing protein n=1 Tax=Streptomyces canus TaxID=58343 RepID=UPI003AF40794
MGTWGTGPFDSELAADFVDELEGLSCQQVIDVLDRAFQRVTTREHASMVETAPKPLTPTLSSPAPSRTAAS